MSAAVIILIEKNNENVIIKEIRPICQAQPTQPIINAVGETNRAKIKNTIDNLFFVLSSNLINL